MKRMNVQRDTILSISCLFIILSAINHSNQKFVCSQTFFLRKQHFHHAFLSSLCAC